MITESLNDVLLIATIAMLTMAVFIIVFVAYYQHRQAQYQLTIKTMQERHRQDLTKAAFRGQEDERKLLAQFLHDDVGTMLSVVKMNLAQLENLCGADEMSGQRVQQARLLLDDTILNVRRVNRNLVPTTLQRFGLIAALDELVNSRNSPESPITFDRPDDFDPLPPTIEVMLYRVAEELLGNAVYHAGASHIILELIRRNEEVRLAVLDDGRGFDLDQILQDSDRGLGLRTVESRLTAVNGHITFDAAPGHGAKVYVQIPLDVPSPVHTVS
jgi:signal transduction histidine kinase